MYVCLTLCLSLTHILLDTVSHTRLAFLVSLLSFPITSSHWDEDWRVSHRPLIKHNSIGHSERLQPQKANSPLDVKYIYQCCMCCVVLEEKKKTEPNFITEVTILWLYCTAITCIEELAVIFLENRTNFLSFWAILSHSDLNFCFTVQMVPSLCFLLFLIILLLFCFIHWP